MHAAMVKAGLALESLSAGDWAAWTAAAIMGLAYSGGAFLKWVKEQKTEAVGEAVTVTNLKELEAALTRLFKNQEKLDERQAKHEIECAEFRGGILATQRAGVAAAQATQRAVENLQSQIRFVAAGAGNRAVTISPSSDAAPEG